jgi:hypothetical protein
MAIQAIFRDIEFAADEPLCERSFPFENFFPSSPPNEFVRFACPKLGRLPDRFPVHSPVLSEALDSRIPAELRRRFENAFLDQMRLDIGLH